MVSGSWTGYQKRRNRGNWFPCSSEISHAIHAAAKKVLSQPAFSQSAYICMQAQPTCSFVLACIQSICIHWHAGSACMQFCPSLHSVSLHSSASRLSLHLASGHTSACRPSLHAVLSSLHASKTVFLHPDNCI